MQPENAADVTFDASIQGWVMRLQDVNPAVLGLRDPGRASQKVRRTLAGPPLSCRRTAGR